MMPEDTSGAWRDEIVEEVRRIRKAHAARFNDDLDAIIADIKSREHDGGFEVVTLPPEKAVAAAKRDG